MLYKDPNILLLVLMFFVVSEMDDMIEISRNVSQGSGKRERVLVSFG